MLTCSQVDGITIQQEDSSLASEHFEAQALEYLKRIDRYLFALAEERLVAQRQLVERQFLTTDARRTMWESIDGARTVAEIAAEAGVTGEAARLFVNELAQGPQPVIEWLQAGRARIPKRLV